MRMGKIVYLDSDGRGTLIDSKYPTKGYKFTEGKGFRAGQYVAYESSNLNPITGYAECTLVMPNLPIGGKQCLLDKQ